MADFKEEIDRCIKVMREGGVILYPTDTIWGIGCDATNAQAVEKIYKIKQRAESKSMLILTDNARKLEDYSDAVPEIAYELIETSERPLTLVLDEARGIAPALIAADGSVGIRVSKERFSAELCRQLRRPLVSTSANISGSPSPRFFKEIAQEIIDAVDYVADWRRDDETPAAPSAIIKISALGVFKILRQ
jgi:L-threonylcarbamoyladenylate synthase